MTFNTRPPGSISGPSRVCPTDTKTYSIAAIPGASSYTWLVPNGWRVNGQLGPTVNTTSTSVQIKAGTGSGSLTIKVRAEGQTCGSSSYTSKNIKLDYTPKILLGPPGGSMVEFDAVLDDGSTSSSWATSYS